MEAFDTVEAIYRLSQPATINFFVQVYLHMHSKRCLNKAGSMNWVAQEKRTLIPLTWI